MNKKPLIDQNHVTTLANHLCHPVTMEIFGNNRNIARHLARRLMSYTNMVGYYPTSQNAANLRVALVRIASAINSVITFDGDEFISFAERFYQVRLNLMTGQVRLNEINDLYTSRDIVLESLSDQQVEKLNLINTLLFAVVPHTSLIDLCWKIGENREEGL